MEEYHEDKEFHKWVETLSQNDVMIILHDFYCCLVDDGEIEVALDDDIADKRGISIRFWLESVLFDIDKEVAQLGYDIIRKYYPQMLIKQVTETAKLRGLK